MKLSRRSAVAVALGLGALSLTGCQVAKEYGTSCSTNPPVPHHNFGVVTVTIDIPPTVEPGATFDLVVEGVGLTTDGQVPPPPAATATITISGPAEPSGAVVVDSFPHTVEVTATGQAGEIIDIGVDNATTIIGTFPEAILVTCRPSDGFIASVPILVPEA